MDQYRIVQFLQELINSQNQIVSQLNGFMSETQNSGWSYNYPPDYYNVIAERDSYINRCNDLQTQVNQLQSDFNNFTQNSSNANAELDATRALLEAIRSERDHLQGVVSERDNTISSLTNDLNNINSTQVSLSLIHI